MEKNNRERSERSNDRNNDNSNEGRGDGRRSVRNKYRAEYSGDHVFDYKDPASLSRFIADAGKITPARISKLSLSQQKKVAGAVKKARSLGLLPNGTDSFDTSARPELISPAPFDY